jgi:hypothetical protein
MYVKHLTREQSIVNRDDNTGKKKEVSLLLIYMTPCFDNELDGGCCVELRVLVSDNTSKGSDQGAAGTRRFWIVVLARRKEAEGKKETFCSAFPWLIDRSSCHFNESELFSLSALSPSCNSTHFTILRVIMLYCVPFVYMMIHT